MNNKENILNGPNLLCLARVLLSFALVYMVFAGFGIVSLVVVFAVAALTDAADGVIARKFNLQTEFGRKFDMFADRVLMISVALAVLSYMDINGWLTMRMLIQVFMIMSREIIAIPFLILALITGGNVFPHARYIAKVTTCLQGFTFPMILLGWKISCLFSLATFAAGIISALLYAYDSCILPWKEHFNKNIK